MWEQPDKERTDLGEVHNTLLKDIAKVVLKPKPALGNPMKDPNMMILAVLAVYYDYSIL